MLIFETDKEIQVCLLEVKKRSAKRQESADEKHRLWPCRRARVAFITHGVLANCFFLYCGVQICEWKKTIPVEEDES
jgi:hypothetical protein